MTRAATVFSADGLPSEEDRVTVAYYTHGGAAADRLWVATELDPEDAGTLEAIRLVHRERGVERVVEVRLTKEVRQRAARPRRHRSGGAQKSTVPGASEAKEAVVDAIRLTLPEMPDATARELYEELQDEVELPSLGSFRNRVRQVRRELGLEPPQSPGRRSA